MSQETAEQVQAAWCDVFGKSPADPEQDFFRFGGNSLLAIKLQRALLDRTGMALTVAELVAQRTIATQAAYIDRTRTDA
ncbi:MAG TPA: acyl carrier protein [Pseudonocardiaceae bacterium]|nr:acyl carrier protein [Pseudonocardiaceae bacterium]